MKRRYVAVLIASLASALLGAQTPTVTQPPIIDVHWHAPGGPADLHTPEAVSIRRTAMNRLDSLNVRYIVVNGVPDALAVWRDEFSNRVIPALLFPCYAGKAPNGGRPCFPGGTDFPDIAWLRSEIKSGRIKALGEITAQYLGIAPNDQRLEPYFALAEEFDIPVMIHIGLGPPGAAYPSNPFPYKSPDYRAAAGSPLLLEDALLRHKRLRVSIMHAGWPLIDETIFMLHQHPQVYVDVAYLQYAIPRPAYFAALRKLVDTGFADWIMVGSDSGAQRLEQAIEAIQAADFLSDMQKRDILYANAARFFKLDTQQSPR